MDQPWADRPFKLIVPPQNAEKISKETVEVATAMALAHNIMVRNLNAIYLQAQGVSKPSDITDFIVFCQMVYETIHHHHHLEETIFFPMVANYTGVQGIMDGNLEQHHAFEDGLNKFKDYIYSTSFEQYDGKVLKEIIDTFGPALETHLADEIQTLLGLEKYGGERLLKVWHDFDKEILKQMGDKHRVLPAALGANDVTFEGGAHSDWPPIPWFLPYLSKYYFMRKYKGSWRFSPCTTFGKPQQLRFVPAEK